MYEVFLGSVMPRSTRSQTFLKRIFRSTMLIIQVLAAPTAPRVMSCGRPGVIQRFQSGGEAFSPRRSFKSPTYTGGRMSCQRQGDARNRSFYMEGRIAASKTQTPRLDRERSLEVSCCFLHVSVVNYFVVSVFISPAINARFFSVSVWSNFSTPPSRTWLLKVLR